MLVGFALLCVDVIRRCVDRRSVHSINDKGVDKKGSVRM